MQSKLHFRISLDTTDNAAVDLTLWLLVLVVLLYLLHDGLLYRLQKKMGRELLMCAAPELIDVAMRKKSLNSLRNTVTKTARKQLGGGRRRRNTSMTGLQRRWSVAARKRKTTIRKKTRSARNRADFFLKQKTDRLIVTQ